MKKKWKQYLLVLVAAVAVFFGTMKLSQTMAYFTDYKSQQNLTGVGSPGTDITEDFPTPTPNASGVNSHKKAVAVTNTGNVDEYVRVRLVISDADVPNYIKYSGDNGATWYTPSEYVNHLPTGWTYKETDGVGYFYYTEKLPKQTKTTDLITNVQVNFPSKAAVISFNLSVVTESTTTLNNDGEPVDYAARWAELSK